MKRFRSAAVAAITLSPVLASAADAPAAPRPNIIVILADDYGYADLGVQGCKDIPTPGLDSLARNGVRFTSGYVSCPVCSPTRAGLLTGRYQQRFGHEFNPGALRRKDVRFGLPLGEKTLADRLGALGYATALVGKWHLGADPGFLPRDRGFQESFGFLGGARTYDPAKRPDDPIRRGSAPAGEKEYLTDAFTREAVAFIDRNRAKPFYLYLAYNAVHGPLDASEKRFGRFTGIADPKRRTFASMLAALDDGVGAVLGKLREAGLEDRTLVFFLSDNGGPTGVNTSRNDPLRGTKGQVWEGGIRVPFLIQWKGRLPAGKVLDDPVISLDIVPTALAAAGGPIPAEARLDGVDLLPYLTGAASGRPHESLFWRFGGQRALRQGDWKLVKQGSAPWQLYDLKADIGETKDLAASRPEIVEKLRSAWTRWDSGLAEPLWGPAAEARKAAAREKAAQEKAARRGAGKAAPREKAAKKAKATGATREF